MEEGQDGVQEEEEDHAEDDDLLEAYAELRGGHLEGGQEGGADVIL